MDEEPKRGPGRPRKEETAPSTVRLKAKIDCWDSIGKHDVGTEFEASPEDAEILVKLGQAEKC